MDIDIILPIIKTYYSDLDSKEVTLKLKNVKRVIESSYFLTVLKYTSHEYSDKAKMYLYVLKKFDIKCLNDECDNIVKFDNEKNTFRQYCCVKCRNTDIKMRKKISESWDDDKKHKKNLKTVETCLTKYGVSNVMKSKVVKDKAKQACLTKYGACSSTYKHFKNIEDYNKEFITKTFIIKGVLNITEFVNYFNLSKSNVNKRLAYFDIDYSHSLVSSYEQEVYDFINTLNVDNVIQSSRSHISPLELDICIPDQNIAIEFNGLYWHSFGTNNVNDKQGNLNYQKNRHLLKTTMCEDIGIQLYHIFEDEWIDPVKQDIWKSMLRNALGKTEVKYRGSDLKIKEVSVDDARSFLNDNHMQGYVNSSTRLGLYLNDDLKSIMTFGKSRYDNTVDYEILRFCSLKNTMTHGAATKLLKYFMKTYDVKGIVSYANRRWSNGNLYKALGFEFISDSNPNHFPFKRNGLESRRKYQKHKLNDIEGFDFNSSETAFENLLNNGYRIIFDSGNKVYRLHNDITNH